MKPLIEVLRQCRDALETAKNGLAWYQDRCPDSVDGSDDEASTEIDEALAAADAALSAATVDEREAFEVWTRSHWGCDAWRHSSNTCGEWDAWQARASLAAPAPAQAEQVTDAQVDKAWGRFEVKMGRLAEQKAKRVHAMVNDGPFPGMSEAFDAHMGAACWTDPAYRQDAATWAAAWRVGRSTIAAPAQAVPLTGTDLRNVVSKAHVAFCLDEFDTFEAALVRLVERHHGITGDKT